LSRLGVVCSAVAYAVYALRPRFAVRPGRFLQLGNFPSSAQSISRSPDGFVVDAEPCGDLAIRSGRVAAQLVGHEPPPFVPATDAGAAN